jgi:hypothetical protein
MNRVAAAVVACLLLAACTSSGGGSDTAAARRDAPVGVDSPSLTAAGRDLARTAGLEAEAPRYRLSARVDPEDGRVEGTATVDVPVAAEGPLLFRVFPNLPALATGFRLGTVRVGGREVDAALDRALLRVPVPPGPAGPRLEVGIDFSYQVPETEPGNPLLDALGALGGEGLAPAAIGLLARHPGGLALGHWFPTYLSPGTEADPEPGGFGDIGNFPAAFFSARFEVPRGWEVVTGGVARESGRAGDRSFFVEEGAGLRDLAAYVGRDLRQVTVPGDGVEVRVLAPAGSTAPLEEVAAETRRSLAAFQSGFGPYPWTQLDVVGVPLGSAVGGMEWPGMVWISADIMAGGIPGFGSEVLGGLGSLVALLGGAGELFTTLREFVIAHEVAHQWWHALVGNDSITAPVVDEPLAQFSACLYWEQAHGAAEGRRVCDLQVPAQYRVMRALGQPDAPADQPTEAFVSSLQYGGVVYGKAPGFYQAARSVVGDEALLAGLRGYVATHAFGVARPADLLAALQAAAPDHAAALEGLWRRWIQEAHGDADLGVDGAGAGDIGGLGALGGLLGGASGLGGIGGGLEQLLGPGGAESAAKALEDLARALRPPG